MYYCVYYILLSHLQLYNIYNFLVEIPEEEDSGEEEGEEDMEGEGETDDQGGDGSLLTTPHHGKTRRR